MTFVNVLAVFVNTTSYANNGKTLLYLFSTKCSYRKGKRSTGKNTRKKPHYGAHAKEVTVDDTFLNANDPCGTMHTILKLCPNIEVIWMEEINVTEVLSLCLMKGHVELKYLKEFTAIFDEGECQIQDVMGPFVLIKFCKTLQDLTICLEEEASSNPTYESRRQLLAKHLKKFKELKYLHIPAIADITYAVFDQILDDCPASMAYLQMQAFDMS